MKKTTFKIKLPAELSAGKQDQTGINMPAPVEESTQEIFNLKTPSPSEKHLVKMKGVDAWGMTNKTKR